MYNVWPGKESGQFTQPWNPHEMVHLQFMFRFWFKASASVQAQ